MSDKEPQQWMRDAAKEISEIGCYCCCHEGSSSCPSCVHCRPEAFATAKEPHFRYEYNYYLFKLGTLAEIIAAHCPEKELGHGAEQREESLIDILNSLPRLPDPESGKYPIARPSEALPDKCPDVPNLDVTPGGKGECVSCGVRTIYVCPFCKVMRGQIRWLCEQPECREKHETVDCARTPSTAGHSSVATQKEK